MTKKKAKGSKTRNRKRSKSAKGILVDPIVSKDDHDKGMSILAKALVK